MRVVSLLPSATEILYAIGAGDLVVGVTHECDYPADARAKPHLTSSALPSRLSPGEIDRHVRTDLHAGSSIYHLDAAMLNELAPDLIVTQELCPVCAVSYELVSAASRRLSSDPRVVSLEPSSLEDLYSTILTVGELVGARAKAANVVEGLRARADRLRALTKNAPHPRTLVLEWTDPPMSGGHWTPDLVELAGGEPVLAHAHADSQRLTWNAIAESDPDIVLVAPCGFGLERSLHAAEELHQLEHWRELRAARASKIAVIDGNNYVNRPGPRLLDTAEIFAAAIHPELAAALPHYAGAWSWLGATEQAASTTTPR